jgi:hypothetical protein
MLRVYATARGCILLTIAIAAGACGDGTRSLDPMARAAPRVAANERIIAAHANPALDARQREVFLRVRANAAMALAQGRPDLANALAHLEDVKAAARAAPARAATTNASTGDDMHRLGEMEQAQANTPVPGWTAQVLSGSTTPTAAIGAVSATLNSGVVFFGTHGENTITWGATGTYNTGGNQTLPADNGNNNAWGHCFETYIALAGCRWVDDYHSAPFASIGGKDCGVTVTAFAAHRAWFFLPSVSFGTSGPSLGTPFVPFGTSSTYIDDQHSANNGVCITVTAPPLLLPGSASRVSTNCNATWSSSNTDVLFFGEGNVGTSVTVGAGFHTGTALVTARCGSDQVGTKLVVVGSPKDSDGDGINDDQEGGGGGTYCLDGHLYEHFHKGPETGGEWVDMGEVCLQSRSSTEMPMVSVDLATSGITQLNPVPQPSYPPGDHSGCGWWSPDTCNLRLGEYDLCAKPGHPYFFGGIGSWGGGTAALPKTVTVWINGNVVSQTTITNVDAQTSTPGYYPVTGSPGQLYVVSARLTDAKGITMSITRPVGIVEDDDDISCAYWSRTPLPPDKVEVDRVERQIRGLMGVKSVREKGHLIDALRASVMRTQIPKK